MPRPLAHREQRLGALIAVLVMVGVLVSFVGATRSLLSGVSDKSLGRLTADWGAEGGSGAARPGVATDVLSLSKMSSRPVGSPPLADAVAAAHVRRDGWDPSPQNAAANHRVPTAAELARYRRQDKWRWKRRVTGGFRGTTDEIIQWAAWKWGFAPDVLRAVATQESWWDQAYVGDGGLSFGLMQIKSTDYRGTYPLSRLSTAFNVDYYAGQLRWCYDGRVRWLNRASGNGATYAPGDLWGCVGFWYSGRWHDGAADRYAGRVRHYLAEQTWRQLQSAGPP